MTTTLSNESKHKHYSIPEPIHGSGDRLQSILLKIAESAKYCLAFTPDLSDEKTLGYQRTIWSANKYRRKSDSTYAKRSYSYSLDSKIDEIELQNFDESLKQNVQVDIHFDPKCEKCSVEAQSLKNRAQNIGSATLIDVTCELTLPKKEWQLETWPHIEVNGREVTQRKLKEFISDARYIRALEARKTKEPDYD
jgi:hypothetical protein